jgi:hypothetical protein
MILTYMRLNRTIFVVCALCLYVALNCLPIVLCREPNGREQVESRMVAASCVSIVSAPCLPTPGPAQAVWFSQGACGCHDTSLAQPHIPSQTAGGHAVHAPLDTPLPAVLAAALATQAASPLPARGVLAKIPPSDGVLRAHRTVVLTC